MFLTAIVFMLRELIEAALLFGILLQLINRQPSLLSMQRHWIVMTLISGVVAAVIFAELMPYFSPLFDYAGFEIVNACVLLIISGILLHTAWSYSVEQKLVKSRQYSIMLMITFVMMRQGSEIILYLQSMLFQPELFITNLFASLIALAVGLSSGLILHLLLSSLRVATGQAISVFLLAIFTGNMLSQSVQQLTQAEFLPPIIELWDSNQILSENSLLGAVLNALIGYEATPTYYQLLAYLLGIILIFLSPLWRNGVAKILKRIVNS